MSEKRFESTLDEDTMSIMPFLVSDNEEEAFYNLQGCVDLLNEQQATINHLKQELEEYKENWDDIVEMATKTSLRNIELDEQIGQLKAKLREKEQDERLYANEIVKLNKEAKEVLDFKSLGGDY